MKTARFVSAIVIGFMMVFFTTPTLAQQSSTPKVFKWKMQAHLPAGSLSFKPLKDFFDHKMTKLTDGRLQITLYPAGALIPTQEIFAAVRKGTLEAAQVNPIYWMNMVPLAAVAAQMPFTFRDYKEALNFHFNRGFEDMMKEELAKYNLLYYTEKIYPVAIIGKKPIVKIDDFKGYKLRSGGVVAGMLNDLGASTANIPVEELFMALQTGVVDGAHNGAALGALSMKYCEVAKYYIQPNLTMSAESILINKDAFNALPKDLQTIFDKAMKERTYEWSAQYADLEGKALATMIKDYNVTVCTLPQEDQKKMRAAAMKQWDIVAGKDAQSAKAVGMLRDYLKELHYID